LKGCSTAATRQRRGIDWPHWTKDLHWVNGFDACALSLGIDPKSFDDRKRYYDFGPGAHDRPGAGISEITRINTMAELHRRKEALSQAVWNRQHFSAPLPGMTRHDVILSEFATWANGLKWPLPAELIQLIPGTVAVESAPANAAAQPPAANPSHGSKP
jgi:hypothetical protein